MSETHLTRKHREEVQRMIEFTVHEQILPAIAKFNMGNKTKTSRTRAMVIKWQYRSTITRMVARSSARRC